MMSFDYVITPTRDNWLTLFYTHKNGSILVNIHAFYEGVSDERLKPIIVGALFLYINGKGASPSALIKDDLL